MAGRKTKVVLSSEDWLKRYRIVFAVSMAVMAVIIAAVFVAARADMIEMQAVQGVIRESLDTGVQAVEGGAL